MIAGGAWRNVDSATAEEIEDYLIKNGGEEREVEPPYEIWRIRFSDSTFTYYSKNYRLEISSKVSS